VQYTKVLLGMLPFARELTKMGTQVCGSADVFDLQGEQQDSDRISEAA
jgi:hypothetical protein